ncbi:MAG: SUMF1/EgtB/PvdO family nonheme iron enzyme [Muribaculaceae bacterium]|nr:SUMF1/EgtB/PvdO family nonheme iron enzyme [Muribaculaceae bacterium]
MWQREWCQDWYDSYYYRNSPSVNPTGPETGGLHVPRGGSYASRARSCRAAARGNCSDDNSSSIGLRLAM